MTTERQTVTTTTGAQLELQQMMAAKESRTNSSGRRQCSRRWFILRDAFCGDRCGVTISIIFSLACFCGISIDLSVYDGKPFPTLPQNLTPNAIISVLAAGSESVLLFSVASDIGQWKWIWHRQQKRHWLLDLQLFADGSPGRLGATKLLFSNARAFVGVTGAGIVLFALAYDPFVQQLLANPVQEVYAASGFTWTRQVQIYASDHNLFIRHHRADSRHGLANFGTMSLTPSPHSR